MRTSEELRNHFLEQLEQMLQRPWMAFGADAIGAHVFGSLTYIDEREEEHREWLRTSEAIGRYASLGFQSPFCWTFGISKPYEAELSSVYAERAHSMGYLKLQHLVTTENWKKITDWAASITDDLFPPDVEKCCGAPSLICADNGSRTYLYACEDPDARALCFDFAWDKDEMPEPQRIGSWEEHYKRFPLRDVRLPMDDFYQGLILTPYGRRIVRRCISPDSKYPREKLSD